MGDLDNVKRLYKILLEKSKNNETIHVEYIYNTVADVYLRKQDVDKVLIFSYHAVTYSQSNLRELAHTYVNIAEVHRIKKDYAQSRSFIKNALELLEETYGRSDPIMWLCYNNLGNLCAEEEDYSSIMEYYTAVLEIENAILSFLDGHAAVFHHNIGAMHAKSKDYTKAIEHVKAAYTKLQTLTNKN
ncbi:unnamed protein product [Didymodactylos carnosus]|uniref:Tetratricopeptide repeat protein n=1 Tax=Didymodactylos carnosus TaxID=1234261 RepID=A0A8S2E4N3_9BILA|nr:unnamed protein product [Didymodactylos carnosus]CAF3844155.1 unnamed protein product [Didymodactylos carnosus]